MIKEETLTQYTLAPLFDEGLEETTQNSRQSHRTRAYMDKEDKIQYEAWMKIGKDPIEMPRKKDKHSGGGLACIFMSK
jgi:hypothetical protein